MTLLTLAVAVLAVVLLNGACQRSGPQQEVNPAGEPAALGFQDRLVTIERRNLLNIPIRIGVAGGPGKVEAILGALRGGYVNILVTDHQAANELIKR